MFFAFVVDFIIIFNATPFDCNDLLFQLNSKLDKHTYTSTSDNNIGKTMNDLTIKAFHFSSHINVVFTLIQNRCFSYPMFKCQ